MKKYFNFTNFTPGVTIVFILIMLTYLQYKTDVTPREVTQFLLGERINIEINGAESANAILAGFGELSKIDKVANYWEYKSILATFNRGQIKEIKDPYLLELITVGLKIAEISGGRIDPTVGTVYSLWNLKDRVLPSDEQILLAKTKVGYQKLNYDHINETVQATDGATLFMDYYLLGYGFDKAMAVMSQFDVKYIKISCPSLVLTYKHLPLQRRWKIKFPNPTAPDKDLLTIKLNPGGAIALINPQVNGAIINGKMYHNIIDATTGYPAQNRWSLVTAINPNSALQAQLDALLVFITSQTNGVTSEVRGMNGKKWEVITKPPVNGG